MARLLIEDIWLMCIWHTTRPTAMREALLGCIRSVFATDICLDIACLQTYIVGYENMEDSTKTEKILVGPGNYVMQLRRTCCNTSVTILMQALELQPAARDIGIRNRVDAWHTLKVIHLHPFHLQKVQDLLPTAYTSLLNSLHVGAWGKNRKMTFF